MYHNQVTASVTELTSPDINSNHAWPLQQLPPARSQSPESMTPKEATETVLEHDSSEFYGVDDKKQLTEKIKELRPANTYDSHLTTASLPAQKWPMEPVPLEPDRKESTFTTLYDAVLLGIPVILAAKVGLIIAAWHLDRSHNGESVDEVSSLTSHLIKFNSQLVTLFTILFVTIVSTLVRRYALWKAQKGAYVHELEQLQGSTSLPSTLKLIWSLRAFTTTSLALIAVWSFYYVGSQASTREYMKVDSGAIRHIPAVVSTPDATSAFEPKTWQGYEDLYSLNAQFMSASGTLGGGVQTTSYHYGTDVFGFPIIPNLDQIMQYGFYNQDGTNTIPKPDRHGWVDVSVQSKVNAGRYGDDNSFTTYFTSLVGRQLLIYQGEGLYMTIGLVGDYKMQSSYMSVSCTPFIKHDFDAFPNGTAPHQAISLNMTDARPDAPKDEQGHALREFDYWVRWVPDDSNPSVQITTTGSAKSTCSIKSTNVELQVHCSAASCYPRKIRYPKHQNATSNLTPMSDMHYASEFFSNLLLSTGEQKNLTKLTSLGKGFTADLIQQALGSTDSGAPDPWDYSFYLTEYINSYFIVSQYPEYTNELPDSHTWPDIAPGYEAATLHGAVYNPHYAISWAWITLDLISCAVLFVAAMGAVWLRSRTLAPDILGCVSSLTRDNPHLELPESGTTLGGIERARLLRNVKVRLGDISGDDTNIGKIGLARVDAHLRVDELRRSAAYV